MDKKSVVRRKRFNYQAKAKCALIAGVVIGLVLVCVSGVQLYNYHKERGTMTTEELNTEIEKYAEESGKYEKEKNEELEKNGRTKKYLELSQKWADATKKKTDAQHSIYMDNTGYHNPRNLWEFIMAAPLLFVGVLCVAAGLVARSIILEKGKKKEAEKKKKAEKAEKEKKEEKK